ncbi:hypothetical protein FRC07_005810 [Ceratobasidium sp. 392]|nr:hypothetical protein FRC07_005810 [Ceratobasidium sp. 392]
MFAEMYYGVGVETACALLADMSGGAPGVMVESMTCVVIAVYLAGVLCRVRAAGVWAVLKVPKQRYISSCVSRSAIGTGLGVLVCWTNGVLVAGRFTRRFAHEHRTSVSAALASIYGFANPLLDLSALWHSMVWGVFDIPTSLWLASNPGEARRFALGALTATCSHFSLAFVIPIIRSRLAVPDVVPGTSSVSNSSPSEPATLVHTDEYNASVAIKEGEVSEQTETDPCEELPMKPEGLAMTPEATESRAEASLECKPVDDVEDDADAEDDTEDDADLVYESADEFEDGEEDGEVEKKGKDVDENNNKELVESRIDLDAMLASLAAMSLKSEQEDAISEHDAKSKTPSATSSGQLGTTTFASVDAPAATALSITASSPDVAEMADSTPEVEDTMKDVRDAEQETAIAIKEKVEAHIGTASCTPITAVVTALVSAPVEEHPRASQNDDSLADEPSQQAEHADEEAIAIPRLSLPNKTCQSPIPETAVLDANEPTEYKQDEDSEHEENDGDKSTDLDLTSTISTISTDGSAPTTYPVVDAAATAATLTTTFNFVDRIFEEFMAELAADAIALEKKMAEWAATKWQVLALKGPACTPKVKVDINENPAQAPESDKPLDTHTPTDPPTDTVDASPKPPALVPAVLEPLQPESLPSNPSETTPDVGAPLANLEQHAGHTDAEHYFWTLDQDSTLTHDQEPAAEEGEVEAGSMEVGHPVIAAEEPEGVGIEEQQLQPVAEQAVGQEVTAPPSSLAPAGAVLLGVNAGMGPSSLAAAGPMDIPTALPLLAPAPQPAISLSWTPMGFLGSSPAIRDVGMAPASRRSTFARPVPFWPYDPSNRRSYYKDRAHITALKKWVRPSFLPLGIPIPPMPRWTQLSQVSAFRDVVPPATYDSTSEASYYKNQAWMTALRKQCLACFPGYEAPSFVPQVAIPPMPASWMSPPAPISAVSTWTKPKHVSAFNSVAPLIEYNPTSEPSYYKHRAWMAALRKQCRTCFPGFEAPRFVPHVAIPAVPVSWTSPPTA